MLELSVVICAHNPRKDHLQRVLRALRNQTLPKDCWELLLVDNASHVALAPVWELSWHPNAHHILETELGLAFARRLGIQHAVTDVLVFVDDDNVLDEDYLSEVMIIKRDWPFLGVWGSGVTLPEFEMAPPSHLEGLLMHLTLRKTAIISWSNVPSCIDSHPWGAGMCVRKSVATEYSKLYRQASIYITGHQGKSVVSGGGEDREICIIACKTGFGMGVFPQLRLTHLIPKERVGEKYLLELAEANLLSDMLLDYKWRKNMPDTRLTLRRLLSAMTQRRLVRQLYFGSLRATRRAKTIIEESQKTR